MNTKKIALTALLACVAVLCLALFGCSGDSKANFVGDWTLDSMENSNLSMTADDLSAFGLEITMTVNDDGTGSRNLLGESMDFTWEANSATEMTMTADTTTTFTLEDGKLTGEIDDIKIVFKKA